ncbi:MAG: Cytoplasmic GTPase/eEF2-like protein (ribosomal biogenesis) [Peltula sp. TS41687]|nr:MAG: Cytoplasmic GTPase/eEF2-like protein (ribosomal biogenesis) [Peltula sp. TS41687]
MPVVSPETLIGLQQRADYVRNLCILAHVDHGKTSLTDSLIATNGIISPKSAGKVRYLDSRPDEQLRGITMESSAISLYFSMLRRSNGEDSPSQQQEYLINLIDSPGHIDFSSEVSTASRLCDGAVVLVDAVEGVCSQTVTVLRQTWIEHLKPLLVINKMDRLITELKMSPGEAYIHLSRLLEQVNAVVGSFSLGERMEEDLKWREKMEERVAAGASKATERAEKETSSANKDSNTENGDNLASGNTIMDFEEKDDDENIYFAPEKNNVIFSSAIDGWAFTVRQFAGLYEKKLNIKRATLEKVLWGDYYLDPKTKRVLGKKHLKGRAVKPMFVQLVLETVWAVYEATIGRGDGKGDPAMTTKILSSLSINLPPYILRSKDTRTILTSIFAAWLPLSTAVLVSVIEYIPSPPVAQAARFPSIIDASPGGEHVDSNIREAVTSFRSQKSEPIVAYVSKMVAIPESQLPQNKRRAGHMSSEEAREMARKKRTEIARKQALSNEEINSNNIDGITLGLTNTTIGDEAHNGDSETAEEVEEDPEHLIGFARLYSGTLSVGDEIYVLPPKYSPANPDAHPGPSKTTITALYLMMGRSLEVLTSVPAGVVFGVAGLEGHILKSGTLCSQATGGVNLAGLTMGSPPIVRVALEPENPSDLDKMINGLKLLVQSDPAAEYEVLESGEHVIVTAGELHLERCLKDLRERFARCEIQVGEAIVPYRETIVSAAEMAPPKNKDLPRGTVIGVIASKQLAIRIRVRRLPAAVTEYIDKNSAATRRLYSERRAEEEARKTGGQAPSDSSEQEDDEGVATNGTSILSLAEFRRELEQAFQEVKAEREIWVDVINRIAAFGPRRVGPNVLIDATKDGLCRRFLQDTDHTATKSDDLPNTTTDQSPSPRDISDKITYAFQLATAQGPLCHEPMQGVAVFLEEVTYTPSPDLPHSTSENLGRMTSEVIKIIRDSIRQGFLDWSPRLLLAMYSCEIQASTEVLGRVYGVITRRRGRILSESLKEGTPFFTILSVLPVAESFGFSDEIRKRTSGAASPQLIFHGFEMLDEDPFWVPFTEEDLEDLGETADRENVAKRYMDRVRKRKGLYVTGRKLVERAEKQKTLKR